MPKFARIPIVMLVEIPDTTIDAEVFAADYVSGTMESAEVFDWSYPMTSDGKHFAYGDIVEVPSDYEETMDSILSLRVVESWSSRKV